MVEPIPYTSDGEDEGEEDQENGHEIHQQLSTQKDLCIDAIKCEFVSADEKSETLCRV